MIQSHWQDNWQSTGEMFASPPRPAKLLLGSGTPAAQAAPALYSHLWPQGLLCFPGAGHPIPSGVGTRWQTPKVVASIRPFPWPQSVTHGLWAPSLPPMEAGRRAAQRGGLEAGFSHRPGGPLPGGGFLFIPYSFLVALVFLEVRYTGSLLLHMVFPPGAVS